jgi:hypothetical protein
MTLRFFLLLLTIGLCVGLVQARLIHVAVAGPVLAGGALALFYRFVAVPPPKQGA